MKYHFPIPGSQGVQLCISGLLLVMCGAQAVADADRAEKRVLSNEMKAVITRLHSSDANVRGEVIDFISQERTLTVRELVVIVGPVNTGRYTDETRTAAAYILGQLRAGEAADALARSLPDPPGPLFHTDIDRLNAPFSTALIKIGRPAVPALIYNLEKQDNIEVRKSSLGILNAILGGPRHLLELLDKLEVRAKDEKVRHRIKKCIDFSREHYKDVTEPLY